MAGCSQRSMRVVDGEFSRSKCTSVDDEEDNILSRKETKMEYGEDGNSETKKEAITYGPGKRQQGWNHDCSSENEQKHQI